MKITESESREAYRVFVTTSGGREAFDAAIESIPAPLPTLRPIAEMPETVPEGCARVYWDAEHGFCGEHVEGVDTHYADLINPVESPEDKWRAEFEELVKVKYPTVKLERDSSGAFKDDITERVFTGYKLAKSTTQP